MSANVFVLFSLILIISRNKKKISVQVKMMAHTTFDAKNRIWSGAKVPNFFHPKLSLGYAILWKLKQNPNKISQVSADTGIQLTNGDLYTKTINAVQNLLELGFKKNDMIALIARNSHHVAPIVFAALCLGCPINTLDTCLNKIDMTNSLKITNPKCIFCDVSAYDVVSSCVQDNNARIYTFGGYCSKSIAVEELFADTRNKPDFMVTEIDGENHIAFIVYSSGKTGPPKGVCLSHAIILSQIARFSICSETDVVFGFNLMYTIYGALSLLMASFYGSTSIITTESFNSERLLTILERHKVTKTYLTIHQLIEIANSKNIASTNLSSVQIIFSGGAKMPLETNAKLCKYLPNGVVSIGYGLSETAGKVTVGLSHLIGDSEGKLIDGIQMKIIDEKGNKCGIGEDGEICVKLQYNFLGYCGNEEATKYAIDNDGFLLTGDIGHFDEIGQLYFTERKKELLKYCGNSISPTEIENCLIEIPGIRKICVVGIDDQDCGDLPTAVIVRNEQWKITKDEIDDFVYEHFTPDKRLRGGIFFVDSLPTTPSGKVNRSKVKEIARELYNQQFNIFK